MSSETNSSSDVKLSIVTQFYPPDYAATGQFVDELAQHLSHQNMDVQVFTGQPSYAFETAIAPETEQMGKVNVKRSRLLRFGSRKIASRTISSLAFCWHAALHLLKREHRGDILLLTSEPPFLQVVGYAIHKLFKTPYACLVYDLYPEVAVELHVISQNHWITKLWDVVNKRVWRRAEAIIVPCQTMKDRILAKVPDLANKITVIHNWADPTWIKPLAKSLNPFAHTHDLVEPFTVLYSGNMGRCHDMDTILDAAQELQDEPVQFLFVGGGPKREGCMKRIEAMGLKNCRFLPYQDKALLPQSLTACDLSLVSVDVGMEGLVAPSKFYSALAAGRPVAVICERHSYLRSLVADANCGAAFSNGDSKGLAGFIRYLAKDPEMIERLGKAGHRYVQDYFTPQQISRHYGKLLRQAVSQNADLRHAIDSLETANGLPEFQVYYQPIVSLRTGRIISLESLLRWHHPVRGLVCPAEFISAAEETGLIVPLGWWLLNTVCQQLQTWHAHFPQIPLRISINLSSQQFFQSDLVPQIVALLKTYGLDGSCLMLEIKDRTVMEDAAATTALLLQLQAHNIQVCIDDFGASHSALEYLHRFPVNALKADRALVSRIEMNPETVKLLETIAILAKDLGMQAIAGGVETSDQLHRLKEIGFEQGQGYLFSEPVPAETIETLLTSQQQVNLTNITGVSMESSEKSPQQDAPLVLLIDDDRSMRAILKRMIMNEGYRVVEATNGEQGIETYKASRPDLVLLDAMMPQMDGFTCCTRLQQLNAETALLSDSDRLGSATWQAPPVLMITALDDVESVDKAFTAGATDYITKPINWAVFRQKIRQLLKKRNGKHWARL
ncbi:MAG TPA: EAL domain-containing protein [Crinalium sp.]